MTYDDIKSQKKSQRFTLSLEDTFFEKSQEGFKLNPPAVLGLR